MTTAEIRALVAEYKNHERGWRPNMLDIARLLTAIEVLLAELGKESET